jgi:hypothetical protein
VLTESRRTCIQAVLAIGGFCSIFVLGAVFDPNARPHDLPPPAVSSAGVPLGPEGLPNYVLDPDAATAHVTRLVARSEGDFERLTPAEQRWLDSMTAGRGRMLLYGRARELFPGRDLPEPPELAARAAATASAAPPAGGETD